MVNMAAVAVLTLAFVVSVPSSAGSSKDKPNMILVMCDDMDIVLGGVNATPQVKLLSFNTPTDLTEN